MKLMAVEKGSPGISGAAIPIGPFIEVQRAGGPSAIDVTVFRRPASDIIAPADGGGRPAGRTLDLTRLRQSPPQDG